MSRGGMVLVLDTSAFMGGFNPLLAEAPSYTTPQIIEELNRRAIPLPYSVAVEQRKLTISTPDPNALETASRTAEAVGDRRKLSEADLSLIALGLDLKGRGFDVVVVTDDYSIQNVAGRLELPHQPLSNLGIRTQIRWILYCSSCRRTFPPNFSDRVCPTCGGEVKRRASKSGRLKSAIRRGNIEPP